MNYPRYVEIDLTKRTVKVSTFKGTLTLEGKPIWTVNSDLKAGAGRHLPGTDLTFTPIQVSIQKDGEEIASFEAD